MKYIPLRVLILVTLFGLLALSIPNDLQAGPGEEELAARNQALAEADERAFKENMAAYDRDVKPFLEKHCISCHGPKKLEGDLALDLLDADMKDSTSGARWAIVREKLEKQEMPPKENPQPAKADVEKVLEWMKAEMKRARRNFTRRVQFVHGNRIPHNLLFDPANVNPLDVPPRLRRQSAEIYEDFRKEQAKGFDNLVSNPFTPDQRFLFKDMGSPEVDVPTTSQLLRNALTIVERQTGHTIENGKLKPMVASNKQFLEFVDPQKPLGSQEMTRAVTLQFQRALGRLPKEEELEKFVGLMEKNVKEAGRVSGVRYSLAAVYLLPEAVFRFELGTPTNDGRKVRLAAEEIADALAYALTDTHPPDWLHKMATAGELDTSEGVKAAVQKMFKDEKLDKPRIMRFFHEYFEYPKAEQIFKNTEEFKAHKARTLVGDTDNLVRWILEKDQNVLFELLTTEKSFVNTRYDSNKKMLVQNDMKQPVQLAYNLPPDWKWTDEQPIQMPKGTRAGILTQPSWLVAWSVNDDNHAILRGKWIRERLLGNVVPDIPITVDAQLPNEPESTLRHRMRVTHEQYCWQCHKLMNPVGFPFETYDHFGRWRAVELGKPVNAAGAIDLTDDQRIDGTEVTDAVDFVQKLAQSERVEQVFIRHLFRYFAGRNENLGDGSSLRAAHRAYRESGGSFQTLVATILSSDSFLYRTPEPKRVSATKSP